MKVLLAHTPQLRRDYYGERSLNGLRAVAEVKLHEADDALDAAGLIEAARALREQFDPALPAFSAIGYREAWAHLDAELTREQAIELDARRNEQFVKRQATWFRSEPGIEWLDATEVPSRRALEVARGLLVAG